MADLITSGFYYNEGPIKYNVDENVFTISFKRLIGDFRRKGNYDLTTVTVEWENPTNRKYMIYVSLGRNMKQPVCTFRTYGRNTANDFVLDFVVNARWNKDEGKVIITKMNN